MGQTLAVSSMHLRCNLASKGSWQIQFISELACDVQGRISQLLLSPSFDAGHHDKKPMHFFVLSGHISSLCEEGVMATA